MLSTSTFLALAMQCAATVHPTTAQDVAKTESGYNPYAIAEIVPKSQRKPGDKGVISYFPTNKNDALAIVNRIESKQRRYSVGLMQITSTNFAKYGMTAEKLFSPCHNLSVFEKIISDCYLRGGSLERALSCYYSGNFTTGTKKENEFNSTSYIERIGYKPNMSYVVPGTRQGFNEKEAVKRKETNVIIPTQIVIVYPSHFVRGDIKPTQ